MSEENGWAVNLEGWTTMKPVLEWTNAAKGGDMGKLRDLMTEIVVSWPYDGSPSVAESYGALTPAQFKAALKEVGGRVGSLFQG